MGERLQRLPKWARRLLLAVSIVGPVAGAVATIASTYYDVKDRAREANRKSEAGYETLAPAVKELQTILKEGQQWADDTDEEIRALEKQAADYNQRIIRLEAYIDILSRRRNLPEAPPKPKPAPTHTAALPFHKAKKKAKKPARPIPKDVNKAQTYQQQRVQLKCPPGDPLCGALE
jgi:hypothetical protein